MAIRITTYLDENIVKKLDRYENKSKIVKEALNMYFVNKDYFTTKQHVVENNIQNLEFQLENERFKLELIKKQIEDIEKRKNDRPRDYIKSVYTLKCLPNLSEDDLLFQSRKLKVDVGQLKEWLWLDGYYEEIFCPKEKK